MANNNCQKLTALPACTHKLDKRRPALQWSSAEPPCWQMKTSAWLNIAQSKKNSCTPSYKATVANSCCTRWTNQLILTWCDTPWLSWAKQRRALNSIVFCFILHAELNSSCRWTKQSEPLLVRSCPPDPDWNHSVNRFEPIHIHSGLITLVNYSTRDINVTCFQHLFWIQLLWTFTAGICQTIELLLCASQRHFIRFSQK